MKQDEKERQILINRLKTIRDPRERDKIIHHLARTEHAGPVRMEESAEEPWAPPGQAKGPAEARTEKIPRGAGFMLGYAVPAFFILFGLFYIASAVMRLISGEGDSSAGPQIFMGVMFLLFGVFGFLKARRMRLRATQPRGGTTETGRSRIWAGK